MFPFLRNREIEWRMFLSENRFPRFRDMRKDSHAGNPLGSVGPRARELDHLGPLLGFFDDEYSELGRRAAEHRRAQIGKPRLYLGVRKNGVHLLVEAADDLHGRILAQTHGE